MKKILLITISALIIFTGCGANATNELTTIKAETITEATTSEINEAETNNISENAETTTTAIFETTTQDLKETLLSSDRILEAYTDYTNYIGAENFESCVNLIQSKFEGNDYTINITQPTEETLGTIKILQSDGHSLYLSFYPNSNAQEMLTTIEYSLNESVSVSATNEMNFTSTTKYKTRDINQTDAMRTVSGIDEQLKFLANYK